MPSYVSYFKTDWRYAELSPAEQAQARRCEALLRAQPDITAEWLAAQIAAASRELPGRKLRAQGEDDTGSWALVALDGKTWDDPEPVEIDEGADITDLLAAADYRAAGVEQIWTMLFWPERLLEALLARSRELDVSASWAVQRAWRDGKDRVEGVSLAAWRDGPRSVRQSVFLLLDQWAEVKQRAASEDCSMSSLVQRAVAVALPALARP